MGNETKKQANEWYRLGYEAGMLHARSVIINTISGALDDTDPRNDNLPYPSITKDEPRRSKT